MQRLGRIGLVPGRRSSRAVFAEHDIDSLRAAVDERQVCPFVRTICSQDGELLWSSPTMASTESSSRPLLSIGAAIGLAGLTAGFLGYVPGVRWANSYYVTVGSSAVASELSPQELVPPSIVCSLGLVSGFAFSLLFSFAISRWPLATPWRYTPDRKVRWMPGLAIALLAGVAFILLLNGLWNETPRGPLSVLFVFLTFASTAIWLLMFLFLYLMDGRAGLPWSDPLVAKVDSIVFYSKGLSDRVSTIDRRLDWLRKGGHSKRAALCLSGLAYAIVVAAGMAGMELLAFEGWESIFADRALVFVVFSMMGLWTCRMVWDLAVHGLGEGGHARGPSELDSRSADQTLGGLLDEVRTSGGRYDLVRDAMVEVVESAIERHGAHQAVDLQPTRGRQGARTAVVVVGLALSLILLPVVTGEIGRAQGDELRHRVLEGGRSCTDLAGEQYRPFDPLSVGAVNVELLVWMDLEGVRRSECGWILLTSSSRMWVLFANEDGTTTVQPIALERLLQVRSTERPADDQPARPVSSEPD